MYCMNFKGNNIEYFLTVYLVQVVGGLIYIRRLMRRLLYIGGTTVRVLILDGNSVMLLTCRLKIAIYRGDYCHGSYIRR